jgi:hypothetical protein
MTDIRLAGLAGPSNGTNREHIERLTGYSLRRDGDDWIVPEDDIALRRGPSDTLFTVDSPRDLNSTSYRAIAAEYAEKFLNPDFEKSLPQPTEKIPIYGEWGIRTPLETHKLNFFFSPANTIVARLTQETFPFFCSEELGATSVAPISTNASYQQAFLSIAKLLALAQYKGVQSAKDHVASQTGLNAALPTTLDILSYVESLNTMCPAAMSLPLHRVGSSLHFMRPKPWFFPRLAIENVYEQVLERIEPIASTEVTFFTKGQHLQKRAVHSYFLSAVEGVNRLTRFLNDVRTYADGEGTFNPMKMAKAHSVVRLMFADWQSINFTNSRYIKLRMGFAFLDKLANFLAFMRGSTVPEDELFKRLCSETTGLRLAAMLQANFETRFHGLGRLMAGLTQATYKRIHSHVSTQLRKPTCSEYERLDYLRKLRNSAHGAFLKANQFEDVFLAAGGTICMEFTFLPLLLLWGLVADPGKFLSQMP